MPIKIPKGFQRRKSSANPLEEVRNPPEPSFRVFERPGAAKTFDGGHVTNPPADRRPVPPPKQRAPEEEDEDLFAGHNGDASNRYGYKPFWRYKSDNRSGSGGTTNSGSATAPSDSAASSTRLSTSSTNRTTTDVSVDPNTQRPFYDIPVPPTSSSRPGFSVRGRGISFGGKMAKNHPMFSSTSDEEPTLLTSGRERAFTASTASTATPPRLTDADLALGESDGEDFVKMFENLGLNRSSRDVSKLLDSSPHTSQPESQDRSKLGLPARITTSTQPQFESSPYSRASEDSRTSFMRSPSPSKTVVQDNFSLLHRKRQDFRPPKNAQHQRSTSPLSFDSKSEAALSRGNIGQTPSHTSRPDSPVDLALTANAQLASEWTERKAGTAPFKPAGKVMTTAQFEQLKRQQEKDRIRYGLSGHSSSDEESDPNYEDEDEDEAERDKQAVKQRRKQEAHLAVYRQTMMKVTGEQASRPNPNPSSSSLNGLLPKMANSSSHDLSNRPSHVAVDDSADADEDEDVPLGILAAHGFPNKNRPPTQLSAPLSSSNLRGLAQASSGTAAPSVAAEPARRGSLPVFARNLPQDPYYPNLVNPANRESLAMSGGASAPSVPGVPQQNYPVHPGGLVGVIAGEERARAARRGSPNTQGTYDAPPSHPGMPRSHTTGNLRAAGYPNMLPPGSMALTAGDQAQIQMAQQMQQFMHMQQQLMQQMMQMQGQGGGQQTPMQPLPGFLAPPLSSPRPQSMPSPPAHPGRTISTLDPGMTSNWSRSSTFLPTPTLNFESSPVGYTPSIAPSERSNVGMASRYRPVSTIHDHHQASNSNRSSTFTSSTMRPYSTLDPIVAGGRKSPGVNTTVRQIHAAVNDDEDDDRGWTEMKMKRDKKKSNWRMKRREKDQGVGEEGLADLVHGTD